MNKVQENKTDLERANDALIALKPNVTAADRKENGYSQPLMTRYLNGQGKDLTVAIELLEFFRRKIEARRKIIANEA